MSPTTSTYVDTITDTTISILHAYLLVALLEPEERSIG